MDSHREKLEWGASHTERFEREFGAFLKEAPYSVEAEYDADEACHVARITRVTDLPRHLSLILGDAVHGLRSSLDALAYRRVAMNYGREPTQDEALETQFVIEDNPAKWGKQCRRWLRHLDGRAQTEIERLQPHHGGDRWLLAQLRDLSNVDKHRHIHMLLGSSELVQVSATGPGITKPAWGGAYGGRLVPGAIVGRWRQWAHLGATANAEMSVKTIMIPDVAFADIRKPDYDESVIGFLRRAHRYIRDAVFPALEPVP